MDIKTAIIDFDIFLKNQGLTFEAVIIGGAALALLGTISRYTRDCDVIEPLIPQEIQNAAKEFAFSVRESGEFLQDDWLNHEPFSLSKLLPKGWQNNIRLIFKGESIILHTLGRKDLLCTKLFALCDRGSDLSDCLALKPSIKEIEDTISWILEQDSNPDWPRHVTSVLGDFSARLGYGI